MATAPSKGPTTESRSHLHRVFWWGKERRQESVPENSASQLKLSLGQTTVKYECEKKYKKYNQNWHG